VYAAWLGPQFETPAEIRFMRAVGATSPGCRRCRRSSPRGTWESACLGISVVTNMAAGVLPEKIDHEVGARGRSRAAGS
jgi:purine-nucleoside phosphorylase